jgi:hypothetical protein
MLEWEGRKEGTRYFDELSLHPDGTQSVAITSLCPNSFPDMFHTPVMTLFHLLLLVMIQTRNSSCDGT